MIYLLAIAVAVGLAFVLKFIFGMPLWLTIIIAAVILAVRLGHTLYMTYKCKDLKQLRAYFKKSPNLLNYYFYTQSTGDIAQQQKALDDVLQGYSSAIVQGQYKAQKMILEKNYAQAIAFAKTIPNAYMRNETLAIVEATIGKKSAAEQLAIGKKWFKHFIFAILAYRSKNMQQFEAEKALCLANCAGAQYFSNTAFFEHIHLYVKK